MAASADIVFSSAAELGRLMAARQLSPVDVVEAHLRRIDQTEPALNSFITPPGDEAIAAAKRAESEIAAGRHRGPLHGVPIGLKDLYHVAGMPNTSGSKIFADFVPKRHGAVAERLLNAGAILMGKLNLHQFAFGPTGLNADFGDMHNPWDVTRMTGGSSGGSGSAAAAGQCAITLGTDTGGSIRIPSALCGLTGIKPTYGRVSRRGLDALSWSLDHPGPMARSAEDCAIALQPIAGYDTLDPASSRATVADYTATLNDGIAGMRVGVPREYSDVPLDPAVGKATDEAIETLRSLGANVVDISWPEFLDAGAISRVVLYAEAAACHRNLLIERGAEYDPTVRWRFETGLFISGADYLRALRHRTAFTMAAAKLFEHVDIIAGPMTPITAPPLDATAVDIDGRSVDVIAALTKYTRPFNLTGYPALTLPCGFVDGLPVGLQLAGRPFDEATLLRAGHAYQQVTSFHTMRPALP